jgi:anti-sigma factor RsiW
MMTCRELVELLVDFVSDDLPPEHRERVEQHLRRCGPCVAYVESYRVMIKISRKLPCEPLPPQLTERLKAALADIKRGSSPQA